MPEEVTSYFNIFDCDRNLLDQLGIMYQQVFMATSSQDEYYREMTKSLIKANIGSDGKICNEKIHRAVIDLRAEVDAEHEHNINNITSEYVYTSPMKEEKVSIINDLVYYESDEHADTMSDSSKQVDASNKTITDTHIFDRFRNLPVRIVSVKPAVVGVRIIGQGITQGVIAGGQAWLRTLSQTSCRILASDSSKLIRFNSTRFSLRRL